jgi:guanyl-specific ribonuclease Sa
MSRPLAAFLLGLLLACGPGAARMQAPAAPQAVQMERAQASVPQPALATLAYVRAHHQAPPGYEGGRRFGNYERRLPERDASNHRIDYQEWDVHPHLERRNRGAERLITGSDGRAWFTADHYATFVEVKEAP